jgi:hypothetical protein
MITAKKALDALKAAGLIVDWKMQAFDESEHYTGCKWKSPKVTSDKLSISDETYGSKSFLYFRTISADIARECAKVLVAIGGRPNFGWCADNPAYFDLQVSAFHGYHWWE